VGAWDDDDWVGEPPEGRHARERARPGFWQRQWPATLATALLGVLALVVALIVLLG
jgi:hypothetical protein